MGYYYKGAYYKGLGPLGSDLRKEVKATSDQITAGAAPKKKSAPKKKKVSKKGTLPKKKSSPKKGKTKK